MSVGLRVQRPRAAWGPVPTLRARALHHCYTDFAQVVSAAFRMGPTEPSESADAGAEAGGRQGSGAKRPPGCKGAREDGQQGRDMGLSTRKGTVGHRRSACARARACHAHHASAPTCPKPHADPRPIILITTVDIGAGKSDKIELRKGDLPKDAARAFCERHGLPLSIVEPLVRHINDNMAKVGPFRGAPDMLGNALPVPAVVGRVQGGRSTPGRAQPVHARDARAPSCVVVVMPG